MLRLYVVLSVTNLCRTAASKKRTYPETGGKNPHPQQTYYNRNGTTLIPFLLCSLPNSVMKTPIFVTPFPNYVTLPPIFAIKIREKACKIKGFGRKKRLKDLK